MADNIIPKPFDKGNLLTAEYVREILKYSPEDGTFFWIKTTRRGFVGKKAGSLTALGYFTIKINNYFYFAHRLAWLYMTGAWPVKFIDHINGIRTDNRWANLREATALQNSANIGLLQKNKSGYKGVSWDKEAEKWAAQITFMGKHRRIGRYKTAEEAAKAYADEFEKLHGEFARLK